MVPQKRAWSLTKLLEKRPRPRLIKNNLIPTKYWSHQGRGVVTPTRKVEVPNHATSSLPEPHKYNCYAGNQARAQRHVNPEAQAGSAGHMAMAPCVVPPGKGLEGPPAFMSQDRTQKHSSSPLPVPPSPASWTPRNPPEDVGVLRPPPGRPQPRCSGQAAGWVTPA